MAPDLQDHLNRIVDRISIPNEIGKCTNPCEVTFAVQSFLSRVTPIPITVEFRWLPEYNMNRLVVLADMSRHFLN